MRQLTVLALQVYALGLAWVQALGGVRTDEAKYLLNIPYPHPPLLRSALWATQAFPWHELLWRALLATLVVQAVWLVRDMARDLSPGQRLVACAAWLLCGGVVLQAGSVMLAPVTAVQVLVFLWLLARPQLAARFPLLVAVFWLASLFTGMQAVLFAPIVAAVLRRSGGTWTDVALYAGAPIAVLLLYVAGSPLIIAGIASHGERQLGEGLLPRALFIGRLLLLAGSGALTLAGLAGLPRRANAAAALCFIILVLYAAPSRYDYYAILFVPLLIAGLITLLRERPIPVTAALPLLIAGAVLTLLWQPPLRQVPPSRTIMGAAAQGGAGIALIHGDFGHDWQYESRIPVLRYRSALLERAQVMVCLEPCPWMKTVQGWRSVERFPRETWVPERSQL